MGLGAPQAPWEAKAAWERSGVSMQAKGSEEVEKIPPSPGPEETDSEEAGSGAAENRTARAGMAVWEECYL